MITPEEKAAMLRMVSYLRERAARLLAVSERCGPDSRVGDVARTKALGLLEAAREVEDGVARDTVKGASDPVRIEP